jgi:hypothetical protein
LYFCASPVCTRNAIGLNLGCDQLLEWGGRVETFSGVASFYGYNKNFVSNLQNTILPILHILETFSLK